MNKEFKERFNYLMSLSNNDLRKEIENSNWVFILQELRYAGETIEAYENMRKDANEFVKKYQRKDGFLNLNEWQTRDLLNILNKVGDDNE